MPALPPEADPDDTPDPREQDLKRRSGTPAVSPWLILGLIAMGAALVYVVSALL